MSNRLNVLKTVLWSLVGVLAAISVVRFTRGLGAVTNLSDSAPWGLWVGFDVMAGVALAAGGFVVAAAVYIFGLERYREFVRPAILTAWLGYLAVAVGLLYDLGLPWHIWHPAIYPQHHSVLFEVAMCVMLYLAVLTLEWAPTVLEHPAFTHAAYRTLLRFLKKLTIPLVIAGIVLSTLHQSSLGSLFLIAPYRLHPLWYSPIIYLLFFVSAVALGLMTVTVESLLAGYFLGHKIKTKLLSGLGLTGAAILGFYAALRISDLAARGVLSTALDGSWQGNLFISEVAVSAVIPAGLLLSRRVRTSVSGLAVSSALAVFGMVLYRIDVCFVAFARPEGFSYAPSWMEFAVSLGIVAAGTLVFLFFVEHFSVYEHADATAERLPDNIPATLRNLQPRAMARPRLYSLAAVTAAAVTLLFLPLEGAEPRRTPVAPPRTIDGITVSRANGKGNFLRFALNAGPTSPAPDRKPLATIDGNRDGRLVLFDHDSHAEREGGNTACGTCHHLNMPFDRNTSCYECHRDMYEPTDLFEHELHVRKLGGNDGCVECHAEGQEAKTAETATPCSDCHEVETGIRDPIIAVPDDRWAAASSYVDAMHGLCISCHQRKLDQSPAEHPGEMDQCRHCHDTDNATRLQQLAPRRNTGTGLVAAHQ